jgi:hypothetical protein
MVGAGLHLVPPSWGCGRCNRAVDEGGRRSGVPGLGRCSTCVRADAEARARDTARSDAAKVARRGVAHREAAPARRARDRERDAQRREERRAARVAETVTVAQDAPVTVARVTATSVTSLKPRLAEVKRERVEVEWLRDPCRSVREVAAAARVEERLAGMVRGELIAAGRLPADLPDGRALDQRRRAAAVRARVRDAILQNPAASNKRIEELVGCGHGKAKRVRAELEADGLLP